MFKFAPKCTRQKKGIFIVLIFFFLPTHFVYQSMFSKIYFTLGIIFLKKYTTIRHVVQSNQQIRHDVSNLQDRLSNLQDMLSNLLHYLSNMNFNT